MNNKISIIIVNYNAGDILAKCVTSIFNSELDVDVIVVDNASTDESLNLFTSKYADELNLHILRNSSNLGFAKACNIGEHVATGHYLLFLNPDCILERNALKVMLQCIESNSDIGMVGGLLLNPDGSEQIGGRRAIPTPWRSFVRAFRLSNLQKRYPRLFSDFLLNEQPLPDNPISVEAISGACMMVSRTALEDVGLLDESYFMHCEDFDWCMRFRQKGWKIFFVPDARIVHHKGTSSRARPIFVEWHKHKGMIRFYRKFFRHQYPGILMWFVAAGIWLRFGILVIYHGSKRILKGVPQ